MPVAATMAIRVPAHAAARELAARPGADYGDEREPLG